MRLINLALAGAVALAAVTLASCSYLYGDKDASANDRICRATAGGIAVLETVDLVLADPNAPATAKTYLPGAAEAIDTVLTQYIAHVSAGTETNPYAIASSIAGAAARILLWYSNNGLGKIGSGGFTGGTIQLAAQTLAGLQNYTANRLAYTGECEGIDALPVEEQDALITARIERVAELYSSIQARAE